MRTAKKVPKPQAFRDSSNINEKNQDNQPEEIDEDEQILEAFRTFDVDGDGTISTREFTDMMKTCASDLTESDIQEIMKESGLEEKGFLRYNEFVNFWKKMSSEY